MGLYVETETTIRVFVLRMQYLFAIYLKISLNHECMYITHCFLVLLSTYGMTSKYTDLHRRAMNQ